MESSLSRIDIDQPFVFDETDSSGEHVLGSLILVNPLQPEEEVIFTPSPSDTSSRTPSVASTATSMSAPAGTTVGGNAPTIGGVVNEDGKNIPWTGGKPNADWTGLADPTAVPTSPNQMRPSDVSSSQKAYNYRRSGLETKFTKKSDLRAFQKNVWKRLQDTGMDSITYLRDPETPTEMVSVIASHSRFTVETGTQAFDALNKTQYDKYDKMNDKAAKDFLLESLEENFKHDLTDLLTDNDSFVVVWLKMIMELQSTSIDRFEMIRTRIKSRKPQHFSGQNIEDLARLQRRDAKELTLAGQYDHNLTLAMLNIFLLGGGDINEDYRQPLRQLRDDLEDELLTITHKEKSAALQHLQAKRMTYSHICDKAVKQYRRQAQSGRWPPTKRVHDRPTTHSLKLKC